MLCFLVLLMLVLIFVRNLSLIHSFVLRISSILAPSSLLNLFRRIRISSGSYFHCIWSSSCRLLGIFCLDWDSFCWITSCFVKLRIALHFSLLFCLISSLKDLLSHYWGLGYPGCTFSQKIKFISSRFSDDVQGLIFPWFYHHLIFWEYCICWECQTFLGILSCNLI